MTRIRLIDTQGDIHFDSDPLLVALPINWNLLLHEALSGRLQMWQQVTGECPDAQTTGNSAFTLNEDTQQLLKYLLDHGAQVNFNSVGHDRPLVTAVASANEVAVRMLMEYGAQPNLNSINGFPLQFLAVNSGNERILQMVLQGDIWVGCLTSAMMRAAETQQDKMLEMLLDAGATANYRFNPHGLTALMNAARHDDVAAMRVLISHGADPNLASNFRTPLMEAVKYRHENALQLLLEKGADVDALHAAFGGFSALMLAARNGSWHMMNLLGAAGAQMDATNPAGMSARSMAARAIKPEVRHIKQGEGMAEVTTEIENGSWSRVAALLHVSASALVRKSDDADNVHHNQIDWAELIRLGVQGGSVLMAREIIAAAARIDSQNLASWINASVESSLASGAPNWEMIDYLRELGADLHAPVGAANTSALDLAANRTLDEMASQLAGQVARQVAASETFVAAIKEALKDPIRETLQGPVQVPIEAPVQTAVQAATPQVMQAVVQAMVQAATQAMNQAASAAGVEQLLQVQFAQAAQHSPAQVEAIVEVLLRNAQRPVFAPAEADAVDEVDGDFEIDAQQDDAGEDEVWQIEAVMEDPIDISPAVGLNNQAETALL